MQRLFFNERGNQKGLFLFLDYPSNCYDYVKRLTSNITHRFVSITVKLDQNVASILDTQRLKSLRLDAGFEA